MPSQSVISHPPAASDIAHAEANLAAMAATARTFRTPCGDGEMVWRVWGSGPPLLLIHGAQGSWAHWFRNIEALGASHTLWVPDVPGAGDSALPAGDDHAAFVDPIADGIERLIGNLPIDIIGFSFGGILAAHLASRHPARARRIILVDPGGLNTPLGNINLQRLRDLEGAAWDQAVRANMLTIMLHDPARADALATAIYRQGMLSARSNPRPLVLPDHLIRALVNVNAPVDAIWGALDNAHPDPAKQEAALRVLCPDMQFRIVPDAGHWCMFENAEAFNRIALDLLG